MFNKREDELSKLPWTFVILCSNRWLKIEVTAREKKKVHVSTALFPLESSDAH